MATKSQIQWTDATWNIARGCTKVDEDCKFCYMYRDSFDSTRYNPLKIVKTKTVFDLPLKLKEPSKIFTCSLTDFFHEGCDLFRQEAWDIIRKCPQHKFQILTKRPERIIDNLPSFWDEIKNRVWLGTSCGSDASMHRAETLMKSCIDICPILFLSLEPLYGTVDITRLSYVPDWVIVGGESGNETGKYRYRTCEINWIERIVADCQNEDVPVFVKQMGTHLSRVLGMSDRHGGNIDEFPEHLKIRQFP